MVPIVSDRKEIFMKRILIFMALLSIVTPCSAKLNVFACEPEWLALVNEIGGNHVESYSATTALQDPHHIQARPSLLARMRRADLVICTGADLESSWLPVLLRRAGRQQVQPGNIGYLEVANHVPLLGIPAVVDRSMGDVHARGNPHIHTDPRNLTRIAKVLTDRMKILDEKNASDFDKRGKNFINRWQNAIASWQRQASSLRGVPIVVQHNSWIYLSQWLGLKEVATLESKPGIAPTVSHLSTVLQIARENQAKIVVRAAYQNEKASVWFADRSELPIVVLPYTVGGNKNSSDLFSLFDETVRLLLEATGDKHGS